MISKHEVKLHMNFLEPSRRKDDNIGTTVSKRTYLLVSGLWQSVHVHAYDASGCRMQLPVIWLAIHATLALGGS